MASSAAKRPFSVAPSQRTSIGPPSPAAKSSQRCADRRETRPLASAVPVQQALRQGLQHGLDRRLAPAARSEVARIGQLAGMARHIDPDAQHQRIDGASPAASASSRMPAILAPSTRRSLGHLQLMRRSGGRRPPGPRPGPPRRRSRSAPPRPGEPAGRSRSEQIEIARRRGSSAARAGRGRWSARAPRRACPRARRRAARRQRLLIGAVDAVEGDEREEGRAGCGRLLIRRTARLPPPAAADSSGPGRTKNSRMASAGHRQDRPGLRQPLRRSKSVVGLVEIHDLDDAQIVVGADHAAEHADDGQRVEAGRDGRQEDVELAEEAGRAAGCPPWRT